MLMIDLYYWDGFPVADNGFNPFWDESFEFNISRPSLALLRFAVYDSGNNFDNDPYINAILYFITL